jgi:transposase
MGNELAQRLVPDELWEVAQPLIPPARVRPQGGGRSRVDDRAVFTAITFVLTSGCSWRGVPRVFGVKTPTVHRRFAEWTSMGLWHRLHRATLDRFGDGREVSWTRALVNNVLVRGCADDGRQLAWGPGR